VVPIDGMADDKQSRISGYLTEAKV
jgi:hypothetical protein